MQDKELLQQHPLFKRISGQVVWLLFEEHHAPQAAVDAFFVDLETRRAETLDVMQRLLQATDADEPPCLQIKVLHDVGDEPPCARCRAMADLVIPANHPRLMDYMPPFGLGCRARARYLGAQAARPFLVRQEGRLPNPPGHELHCPSEWLFRHDWGGERD